MALISPILDNRSYQQLRDELVKRITVYAPDPAKVQANGAAVVICPGGGYGMLATEH